MILTIYNIEKQIIKIKFFSTETTARLYFHIYYGKCDDFGNLQYYYILE